VSLYRSARFLVYPSFYEGYGLPVAEAMACGLPVITSNNSSLQEIGGNAVMLVDPRNIEELAAAHGLIAEQVFAGDRDAVHFGDDALHGCVARRELMCLGTYRV